MFFRNSLLSDLLFTLVFVLSMNLGRSAEGSRARAAVPRVGLSRHAAGGAARRSRDALADAVDPAFRGTRQSAVSSAEDRWFLSSLHWAGSSCDRCCRCGRVTMITSSPLIAITLTRLLAAQAPTPAWRSFLEKKRAVRAAWVARCIFSTSNITCTAVTPLSAAHVPLAVGMAFAIKYRDEDRVTLCFFGDGAINQGAFHEALNLAALYKLPIVFICENNLFAMGTSVKRSTSLKQIVDRAEGYDIPGEIVDGMNFREVRDKIAEMVEFHPEGTASGVRWKFGLIVIAATRCPIRQVIGPRRSWRNIDSMIRSHVCARSLRAREN